MTTIQKIDEAYNEFSNLMIGVENGEDINALDRGLLDLYANLADAGDKGGLEAASSGNRAAFMQSALTYQHGIMQQSSLPRARQKIGDITSTFEKSVKPLHDGFINDTLMSRVASETGIRPNARPANEGLKKGYEEAILSLLDNPESRIEHELSDYAE